VNPAFSLFGCRYLAAVSLKAVLATVALGAAAVQVLLALWMYRKLPLAGQPPQAVRPAHRVLGFSLFALTIPIALHCLIAYGVQLTSVRVAVHSVAAPVDSRNPAPTPDPEQVRFPGLTLVRLNSHVRGR
jgi:Family of unknown function (DUF6529)